MDKFFYLIIEGIKNTWRHKVTALTAIFSLFILLYIIGLIHTAEKNSFKLSGMGGSRMGEAGYLRFFRKKSMLLNSGEPFTINMFDESNST